MAKSKPTDNPSPSRTLRERAEEMLTTSHTEIAGMSADEIQKLVHELQVHQMELEIQNEDLRQAQTELAHSRDRLSDLYEFAPVGYLSLDRHGVIQKANLSAATMLGVERKDLANRKLTDFLPEDAQEPWHLHRRAVFSGSRSHQTLDGDVEGQSLATSASAAVTSDAEMSPTTQTCELPMKPAVGDLVAVRLESLAFRDDDGNLSGCRTALIDVSTVNRARQQLEESERRYRRLTDAVTDYVYRVRVERGRAVETTHGPNCVAVTGYTPEEFAANPLLWIAMVPTEDRAIVEKQAADILADRYSAPVEHRIQRKDGQIRWVVDTVSPQHDDDGNLIGFDGLVRDITDRKVAEEALRELNQTLEQRVPERTREVRLLAEAMANLGEGVMITTDHVEWPGPQIVYVNEALCRITSYSAEELIGQTPRMLQGERTDKKTIKRLRNALSEKRAHLCELVNYRKDGSTYYAELFITPLYDAAGNHTNFIAIHRDITERKQAEAELRRLSKVFSDSANAILIKDLDGRIIDMNRAAESDYGWTRAELIGESVKKLVPADEHEQRDQLMARCVRGEEVRGIEARRLTKSGEERAVLLTLSLLIDDQGEPIGIATFSEDITRRKQAELALHESEERLRTILNTAADAIINIDQRGIITDVNPATERMFGYAKDELVGQNVKILMPAPYHDEHDGYIARYLETGQAHIIGIGRDVTGRHKDGSNFPIGLAVSEVEHLGLFTGIIRDITERKELQKQVLEIAAEEDRRIGHELHDNVQQQLTGLGLLARTVADRIKAVADTESKLVETADMASRVADEVSKSAQHVHLLSRGLVPVEVDAEGLRSSLADLAERIVEQYGVECDFQCEGMIEVADSFVATHLYRIAQEAVNNAIKHGRAKRIEISLVGSNETLTLNVLDNGIGIGENHKDRAGMGLRIMQYRAGLIGATVHVAPAKPNGTLVTCTVLRGGVTYAE